MRCRRFDASWLTTIKDTLAACSMYDDKSFHVSIGSSGSNVRSVESGGIRSILQPLADGTFALCLVSSHWNLEVLPQKPLQQCHRQKGGNSPTLAGECCFLH